MTKKDSKPEKQVSKTKPEDPDEVAQCVMSPAVRAGYTIMRWNSIARWNSCDAPDLSALVHALLTQVKKVHGGDLTRGETVLMSQAHTLDLVFNELAVLAKANLYKNLEATDTLLRLALRAQTQCRATIETLAEIKNPARATFVRQANIAHGPQQVNNAPQSPSARAEETKVTPSKLLEQSHGERLDIGTAGQAVGSDPAMATMGEVQRPQDRGG